MSVSDFNDCGQIIGNTLVRTGEGLTVGGFVWSRGRLVDLGAAVGVSPTVGVELRDLSRDGQILGSIVTITDPGSESIRQVNRPVLWTIS